MEEVSLNGMSLGGPSPSPLIDEELLMNVMGMSLKEIFRSEFDNFMRQFSYDRLVKQKTTKKIGKTRGVLEYRGFFCWRVTSRVEIGLVRIRGRASN